MKPASFAYHAPTSLEEALAIKARFGDAARFLAGGQSLVPTMNFRLAQPEVVIDLAGVAGLAGVTRDEAGTRIGAMTRYRTLERDADFLRRHAPFADALPLIAHAPIRTRGTIGGNLSHADPASELPAVAVASDAVLHIAGPDGPRSVAASDFFLGALTTAVGDRDMLVAVVLPHPPARSGGSFHEMARRHGDFAIAGVAARVTLDEAGTCVAARIVLCGVADRPLRVVEAEASLLGRAPSDAANAEAAACVFTTVDPPGGLHAAPGYQRHLARVLTARALRHAFARAAGDTPGGPLHG